MLSCLEIMFSTPRCRSDSRSTAGRVHFLRLPERGPKSFTGLVIILQGTPAVSGRNPPECGAPEEAMQSWSRKVQQLVSEFRLQPVALARPRL